MISEEIREELFRLRDNKYRDFQIKLIPTVGQDSVMGVRTPELRKLAKQAAKREDVKSFLNDLPHRSFELGHLRSDVAEGVQKAPEGTT